MNNAANKSTIDGTMRSILSFFNSPQEQKNLAGDLAALRNSIGKGEEAAEVWPILFPHIPSEFLGNGALSYEEKALLVSLQIYAIGQQGSKKIMNDNSSNIGSSLRAIRNENSTAMDRRFNTMLTASTFEEFVYYLRQICRLGKSKAQFSVNFPALAKDLFWYQNGSAKRICLEWAREYYRPKIKNSSNETEASVTKEESISKEEIK